MALECMMKVPAKRFISWESDQKMKDSFRSSFTSGTDRGISAANMMEVFVKGDMPSMQLNQKTSMSTWDIADNFLESFRGD